MSKRKDRYKRDSRINEAIDRNIPFYVLADGTGRRLVFWDYELESCRSHTDLQDCEIVFKKEASSKSERKQIINAEYYALWREPYTSQLGRKKN